MRNRLALALAGVALITGLVTAQAPPKPRLNPVIDLLSQKKPAFGLYAPSNRRPGGGDQVRQVRRVRRVRLRRRLRRHRLNWRPKPSPTNKPITCLTAAWKAGCSARCPRSPS